MNSFIGKLVDRHIEPESNIKPHIPGRFELSSAFPAMDEQEDVTDIEINELSSVPPVSSKNKWKDSREEKKKEAKRENSPTLISPKSSSVQETPLLVADPLEKKGKEEKEISPVEINKVSIQPASKEIILEKNNIVPEERIITRLRKKYIEKINFITTKDEEQREYQLVKLPVNSNNASGGMLADDGMLSVNKENEQPVNSSIVPNNKNNPAYHLPDTLSQKSNSPSINISIGRIEIRAIIPQAETRIVTKKEDSGILSLDQFLEQRKPGKR